MYIYIVNKTIYLWGYFLSNIFITLGKWISIIYPIILLFAFSQSWRFLCSLTEVFYKIQATVSPFSQWLSFKFVGAQLLRPYPGRNCFPRQWFCCCPWKVALTKSYHSSETQDSKARVKSCKLREWGWNWLAFSICSCPGNFLLHHPNL